MAVLGALLASCGNVELAMAQARYAPDWKFFEKDGSPRSASISWIGAYDQPAIYEQWWHEIADCEGLPLPSEHTRVQFYSVNADLFLPAGYRDNGVQFLGMTYPDLLEIYVGTRYVLRKGLVTHETLHIILAYNGKRLGAEHPPDFFEVCGLHATATP